MTIEDIIRERRLREVVHFTTNRGLVGTLAAKAVKSRARLPKEKYLEHVYSPNAAWRKDVEWLDYVNLSISRINVDFFDISSKKWHANEDLWWCVLSFDPVILTHDDVWFTTTNNIYSGVLRGTGAEALERLFARRVIRWAGNTVVRNHRLPSHLPTCQYAEVLYPGQVSTEHLRRVYVVNEMHADIALAQIGTLKHAPTSVVVQPDAFTS